MNNANDNESEMKDPNIILTIESNSVNTMDTENKALIKNNHSNSGNYSENSNNLDTGLKKPFSNPDEIIQKNNFIENHVNKLEYLVQTPKKTQNGNSENTNHEATSTPSKSNSKKKKTFLNIFRHLSHNKHKKSDEISSKSKTEPSDPSFKRQKSFRKILFKFGKKKQKLNNPEGISSITSSITNTPINGDFTVSCNDITEENVKFNLSKKAVASAENIPYVSDNKSRGASESTASTEEMLETEARAFVNGLKTVNSEEKPAQVPTESQKIDEHYDNFRAPLSINTNGNNHADLLDSQKSCTSTKSDNYHTGKSSIKLSLALYGYGSYGMLRNSKNTSRSCMEFYNCHGNYASPTSSSQKDTITDSINTPPKSKSSLDNWILNDSSHVRNTKARSRTIDRSELVPINEKLTNEEQEKSTNPNETNDYNQSKSSGDNNEIHNLNESNDSSEAAINKVAMRSQSSNRPTDIQLRKSKGISSNHTRSSLIMLTVTHNSPRGKISHHSSNQASTPIKTPQSPYPTNDVHPLQISSSPPCNKLAFDQFTPPSPNSYVSNQLDTNLNGFDYDLKIPSNQNEFGTSPVQKILHKDDPVIDGKDGHYYLGEANKCEEEIMIKVDEFQQDLDNANEYQINNELRDQLRCVIGKSKLLISEKFNQFKGLINQNLNDEIADEGYRTLVSDLDGFWSLVMIQVDIIRDELSELDKIKANNWIIENVDQEDQKIKPKVVKKKPSKVLAAKSTVPSTNKRDLDRAKAARQRIEEFKRKAKAAKELDTENSHDVILQ